jgi:hypothetical protein
LDPSDDGGGGGGGGNTFTATIDGVAWQSDTALIQITGSATPTRTGTLMISGFQASTGRSLLLMLSFIIGPATQPLGVNTGTNPGGVGGVTIASDNWLTPLSGKAGFVTITARTDERIAGTFHFTAENDIGAVPATRAVTSGAFDITLDAGLPPLPTGVGSTSTATFDGTPWNAATIVGIRPGPGVFSVSTATTEYTVVFTSAVPITAPGPYGIGSQVQIQVIETGTTNAWAAVVGPDVGTFTVQSIAEDRVVATFSGNIPSAGGGIALAIVGGTVNAHLGS